MWVKSLVIYVDKDGIWFMSTHEIYLWVDFDLSYMLYDVELIWLWKHDEWYEITVNMEMIWNCDDYWIDMELQWLWKVSNLYDGRCDLYIYMLKDIDGYNFEVWVKLHLSYMLNWYEFVI